MHINKENNSSLPQEIDLDARKSGCDLAVFGFGFAFCFLVTAAAIAAMVYVIIN